jgi:hypothetical protein
MHPRKDIDADTPDKLGTHENVAHTYESTLVKGEDVHPHSTHMANQMDNKSRIASSLLLRLRELL